MIDRGILPLRENYAPHKAIDFLLLLFYQKQAALDEIMVYSNLAVGVDMVKGVLEDYKRVKWHWAEKGTEVVDGVQKSIGLMERIMQRKEKNKK